MHQTAHPLKNRIVILNINAVPDGRDKLKPGAEFKVIDWFDRKNGGKTFMEASSSGDIFAEQYRRRACPVLPADENVVIGYIGSHLSVFMRVKSVKYGTK